MIFEAAQHGYSYAFARKMRALDRAPYIRVGVGDNALMAYLNDCKPKRGRYLRSMGGRSKRRTRQ